MPDDQNQFVPPPMEQQSDTGSGPPGQMPPPPPPPPGFPVMLPMGAPKKTFVSRLKDALILIVFWGSLLLNLLLLLAVSAGQVDIDVREKVLIKGADEQRIAIIDVKGIITDELAEQLRPQFKLVRENEKYKGLLLCVDSPGGGVTASDNIAHYVRRTKEAGKPVVVYMGGLAASGGYYISALGDYVMAGPTTITGSIGVIAQLPNLHGTLEKIGAQVVVIPSTPATKKAIGSPFLPWDPANRGYFEQLIDSAHKRFVEVIYEGRGAHFPEISELEKLADGAALTAAVAKAAKLIDEDNAYLEEAIEKAAELAKLTEPKVIQLYRPPPSFRELLSGRAEASRSLVSVDSSLLDRFTTPRLMYLWQGQ